MPPEEYRSPEGLERWRGRVDSFMEVTPQRITTLFEANEVVENRLHLVSDKLTALSTKIAVYAGLGAFVGTFVTSLFLAVIIKVFIK